MKLSKRIFLIIFFVLIALPCVTFAAESLENKFLRLYLPHYEKINAVYRNSQIQIEARKWSVVKQQRWHKSVHLLSNGKLLRNELTFISERNKKPLQKCSVLNPKGISFIATRKDEKNHYILKRKVDAKSAFDEIAVECRIVPLACGYNGGSVLDRFKGKKTSISEFKIQGVGDEKRAILTIDFIPDAASSPVKYITEFAPNQNWVITRFEYPAKYVIGTFEYEGEKNGVPLLKHALVERKDDNGQVEVSYDYTVTKFIPEPAPESMFTFASLDIDYKPPPVSRFGFWFYCGLVGVVLIIGGGLLSRWVKAR